MCNLNATPLHNTHLLSGLLLSLSSVSSPTTPMARGPKERD